MELLAKEMLLRDYFAAVALQGQLSNPDDNYSYDVEVMAAWAYKYADAMLKERGK